MGEETFTTMHPHSRRQVAPPRHDTAKPPPKLDPNGPNQPHR